MEQTVKVKFENKPSEREVLQSKVKFILDNNASHIKELQAYGIMIIFDKQESDKELLKLINLDLKIQVAELQKQLKDVYSKIDNDLSYLQQRVNNERN